MTARIVTCANKMESLAETSYEWSCCAELWGFLGVDYADNARRCLKPAWSLSTSPLDRKIIASQTCSMPLTDQERWGAMKYLESHAHYADDWRGCAETWLSDFKSIKDAKRCLRRSRTSPPGRTPYF